MIYRQKLIISGKKAEFYQYEAPIIVGKKRKRKPAKRRTREDVTREIENNEDSAFQMEIVRDFSLRRTRSKITRLIDSNEDLRTFITLTFADNITDLKEANIIFKKFILRLKYLYKDLKYLAIPEFQKRGAVHYHLLINIEYIDNAKLADIWNQGFVMINKVKHINHLGLYISKYISKNLFDIRYFGMRKILSSRNLDKPIIIIIKQEINTFFKNSFSKLKLLFEKDYLSDWLGKISYQLYSS